MNRVDEAKTLSIEASRLIRLPQVLKLVPVARSTIYEWCKNGRFPKPIKLGERTSCWHLESVLDFLKKGGR